MTFLGNASGHQSTGLSKRKGAKLSEFSLNVQKLADWLWIGWSVCQAATKTGNSNRGHFFALVDSIKSVNKTVLQFRTKVSF